MENENVISVEQLCSYYQVELSFIDSLSEFGLIEVVIIEENRFVSLDQVKDIEKMIRLHFDLNINLEGIDVIYHLLRKVDELNNELKSIKNRFSQK
jgi:hypothetical protein